MWDDGDPPDGPCDRRGDNRDYFSFREKKMLENPHHALCTDYRAIQFEQPTAMGKRR